MDHPRITCDGATIGPSLVPRFQLDSGDLLCLHLSCLVFSREEDRLVQALIGECPVPGLRISGRVRAALPPTCRAGLLGLFHRPRATDWLRRTSGISRVEAGAIVARLDIHPDRCVCRLPGTPKRLLGLEAAWAGGADAILFTTAGLDPLGRRAVFETVRSHISRCPAIHLSHAYTTQGRWERDCPPGASCLDLPRLPGAPVSLTSAEAQD